jgi:hypothetical protein
MTEKVKVALIVGGALLLATCIYSYNTPYQSCVRAAIHGGVDPDLAHISCAKNSN